MNLQSVLIGNVWENKIQDYHTFKFGKDGKGGSYLAVVLQETFNYELNETTLWMLTAIQKSIGCQATAIIADYIKNQLDEDYAAD